MTPDNKPTLNSFLKKKVDRSIHNNLPKEPKKRVKADTSEPTRDPLSKGTGAVIREMRKETGMRQNVLAEKVDYSCSKMSLLETRDMGATGLPFRKICDALGTFPFIVYMRATPIKDIAAKDDHVVAEFVRIMDEIMLDKKNFLAVSKLLRSEGEKIAHLDTMDREEIVSVLRDTIRALEAK